MKKFFVIAIFILNSYFLILNTKIVLAVDCKSERCSACDQCGYCWELTPTPPTTNPPSAWEKCRDCIYDLRGVPAESNETLKIDPSTNLPPTPMPGRMYTQLGCLSTNLGNFQQEGAATNIVQMFLNIIFSTVGGIGFLAILYASFIIITSQGNPERINYGKKMLVGAIVGVIFSTSVVFLINLLANGVLRIPGFGSS